MLDPVQILTIGVSVLLLLLVLELVRRRLLGEEYAFVWIVGALVLLGLSVWRGGLDSVARWLGVHYGPALLLLLLGVFVFLALLFFSVVISRQRVQIERLIEDTAILEARLREELAPTSTSASRDSGDRGGEQPEGGVR
jgi:hypothetical protein